MSKQEFSRIFLCGFMGTGKTTLGKLLAYKLGKPFLDMDDVIKRKARLSIPQLFQQYGEAHFRNLEKSAIKQVAGQQQGVIALGGGALQDKELVHTIKSNGLLVFIDAPFEVLLSRLMRNKKRPMLLDKEGRMKNKESLRHELSELYNKRLPMYRQAHLTFSSEQNLNPNEQAELLKERICTYEQAT